MDKKELLSSKIWLLELFYLQSMNQVIRKLYFFSYTFYKTFKTRMPVNYLLLMDILFLDIELLLIMFVLNARNCRCKINLPIQ